jgi:hypothetical protein
MAALTQFDEARRWTKFPATLLFATCLLWLVAMLPRVAADWDGTVAQPSETLLGAVVVFALLVFIPIASPLAAIGMLYLQRSALYLGGLLPFFPLAAISVDKARRIAEKFAQYRLQHSISSFGDGVLDAMILAGLWLIAAVHVLYIRRALLELAKAEQWQHGGPSARATALGRAKPQGAPVQPAQAPAGDETCLLLPEAGPVDDED